MLIRNAKIIAIIIVASLAILGLNYDFKTANGTLTLWGWLASGLTILSGLTAVFLEIWSHKKESIADQELVERNEGQQNQLKEIKKSIIGRDFPLVPFRIFYTLRHVPPYSEIMRHFDGKNGFEDLKKNEFLERVGTVRMGPVPYNSEEERPKYSEAKISEHSIIEKIILTAGSANTIIKLPSTFIIEFSRDRDDVPFVSFEAIHGAWQKIGL